MQMVYWVVAEGTHIMERTALQASRPGRGAAELSIWNAGSRVGRVPGLVKESVRKQSGRGAETSSNRAKQSWCVMSLPGCMW